MNAIKTTEKKNLNSIPIERDCDKLLCSCHFIG